MIKSITSIESLEAPVRTLLMSQANLAGHHVLNALNIRGPSMTKPSQTLGESIFESMSITETIIVFEILESKLDDDASDTIDIVTQHALRTNESVVCSETTLLKTEVIENKLFTYIPLTINIVLYGVASRTVATTLKTKLLTSAVRDAFFKIGLNIASISSIEQSSEYVNDVLWQRRDFSIEANSWMQTSVLNDLLEDSFDEASVVMAKVG